MEYDDLSSSYIKYATNFKVSNFVVFHGSVLGDIWPMSDSDCRGKTTIKLEIIHVRIANRNILKGEIVEENTILFRHNHPTYNLLVILQKVS